MTDVIANALWSTMLTSPKAMGHIWWAVPLGLLAGWPAVRKISRFSWGKSFLVTASMNFASLVLGFPFGCGLLEARMPLPAWMAIGGIGVVASAFIEGFIINQYRERTVTLRSFPLILLVNAFAGGITIVVVLVAS